MRRAVILTAAAALALTGSSMKAQAQVTARGNTVTMRRVMPAGGAPFTGFARLGNQSSAGFTAGFGNNGSGIAGPLQFVPGAGFASGANITNLGFGGTGAGIAGPLQFVPGTGFVPVTGAAGTTGTGVGFDQFGNPVTNGVNTGFGNGFNGAGTGFNNGFGTGVGAGFNNGTSFDQFGNPISTGAGFSQAGTPIFQPGFGYGGGYYGGGYYGNGYGNGYYGAGYGNGNGYGNGMNGNVVYVPVPVPVPVNGASSRSGTSAASYQSGSRMSDMDVRRAAARPEQQKLASEVQDIMDNHPMTEGEITQLSTGHVTVRYTVDGKTRIERFTNDKVFFFRQNPGTGDLEMATVAMGSNRVRVGDKVMVPLNDITVEPRQAVAGSRQETRSRRSAQ